MGPDNADLAGPWQLMAWPRQTPMAGWAEDLRVKHLLSDVTAIELVDGPWSCTKHEFREEGLFLDLTLMHVESGRTIDGTFDMEDGVWAPADGAGHTTVAEFHRAYAANNSLVTAWPADPFKDVRAPTGVDVGSRDGEYLIDLTTNRWRMSDWICPPRIVHIPTGDCLLDLKTTYWDGRAELRPDGRAELRLLQYPGTSYNLKLELDLPRERYRVIEGSHDGLAAEGYLDELQAALGRPAADLDELGILLDVRASRRAAGGTSQHTAGPAVAAAPSALKPYSEAFPASEPAESEAEDEEDEPGWLPDDEDFNARAPARPVPPAPEKTSAPDRTAAPAKTPVPMKPIAESPAERTGEDDAEPREVGGPELDASAPVTPDHIRDIADAIAAEVTKRGLHGKLQYEMIVIGVIRAAAAGITRPEDAVAILETLALRRGEIGKG